MKMMSKVVVFFLSVLICSKTSQDLDMTSTTASKVNLFNNLNVQLHNLSRSVLTFLCLGKSSTNMNKVNTFIKMADDLINLSESKFKIYREIQKTAKIEVDNNAINALFDLTLVIEEIFKDEYYFLRNNSFLRNDSLIEFYEAVVFNSSRLETILKDWENAKNITYIKYPRKGTPISNFRQYKRTESVNSFRRKYKDFEKNNKEKINKVKRRQKDDLPFWKAPIDTDNPTRRVFLSVPTKIKKYPFVASVLLLGDFVCAGSIVSKNFVLTAASCMQLAHQNPDFLRQQDAFSIRVGSNYATKKGKVIPISEIHFHPNYDPVHLCSNLALGRLGTSINFITSKASVRRIKFDHNHENIEDGNEIVILGWGDRDNLHSYNGLLTKARLRIYSLDDCKKIYSPRYVSKSDFCAGRSNEGSGACNRDVGGPAFINSILVGVISFGPPVCGTPDGPTVFTRVGDYASWIESVVAGTQGDYSNTAETTIKTNTLHGKLKQNTQTLKPNKSALQLLKSIIRNVKDAIFPDTSIDSEVKPPNENDNDDDFSITTTTHTPVDDAIFDPEPFFEIYEDDFGEDDVFWSTTPLQQQMEHNPLVNKSIYEHPNKVIIPTSPKTTKVTQTVQLEVLEFGGTTTLVPQEQVDEFEKYREILESYMPQTTRFVPFFLKTQKHHTKNHYSQSNKPLVTTASKVSKAPLSEENEKLFANIPKHKDSELAHEISYKSLESFLNNINL